MGCSNTLSRETCRQGGFCVSVGPAGAWFSRPEQRPCLPTVNPLRSLEA